MEINKNNYEAYFLDFVEGNLSVALQKELDLFLIQNPELKAELQEFEMIVLDSEDVSNTSLKNSLFREETTGLVELDYLMVSEIEGSITKEEKMKLNSLMAESPSIQKDFIAYQKTKLVPSEKVEFPNKSSLIKKEGKVIYFFRYAAAVAAAILALVWFNINSPEERYNPRTAQKIILELEDDHAIQFAKIIVKEDPIDVVDSQNNNKIEELPMDEPINYAHNKIQEQDKPKQELPKVELEKQEIELPEEDLAEIPKVQDRPVEIDSITNTNDLAEQSLPDLNKKKNKFIPIDEFAKKKLKENVLKNKTFSETIVEELAEATNQKISFESVKNDNGNTEQYALNIGKFSFSRKK